MSSLLHPRPFWKVRIALLVLAAFLGFASTAHATSCKGMEERYYLSCLKGNCAPEFMATSIASPSSMCARRNEVSDIPPEVAAYLSRLIAASQLTAPDGLYSLRFEFYWWRYQSSQTFERFEKNILENIRDRDGRDLSFISIDEVADKLNRDTDRRWIKLESAGVSALQIKQEILAESDLERKRGVGIVAACWTALLALLAVLAYSVYLFHAKLTRGPARGQRGRLLVPVVLQLGLLIAPIVATMSSLSMFSCGAILLIWPLLAIAWLVEGFWVIQRRRTTTAGAVQTHGA